MKELLAHFAGPISVILPLLLLALKIALRASVDQRISGARLVIANVNGRNPNVFYELGIAHAIDKPVLLVAQHDEMISFDIRSQRIIFYRDRDELAQRIVSSMLQMIVREGADEQ